MYTIKIIVRTLRGVKSYNLGRYTDTQEAGRALSETVETVEAGLLTGEEITRCEITKTSN